MCQGMNPTLLAPGPVLSRPSFGQILVRLPVTGSGTGRAASGFTDGCCGWCGEERQQRVMLGGIAPEHSIKAQEFVGYTLQALDGLATYYTAWRFD